VAGTSTDRRSTGTTPTATTVSKSTTAAASTQSSELRGGKLYNTVHMACLHAMSATSLRDGVSYAMEGLGSLLPNDDERDRRTCKTFSYSKMSNLTSTFDMESMNCEVCPNKHALMFKHGTRIEPKDMGPLLFVLSDQHLPACQPKRGSGECIKKLRIEDASLDTLTNRLLDCLRGWVVPAGSVQWATKIWHVGPPGT